MMRRRLLSGTAAAIAASRVARAQVWPNRPIRLVVPYPPGGVSDAVGRVLARGLQDRLGQPVVVDNRAGANGVIGSDFVAKSEPDGHTLLLVVAAHAINPSLMPRMPYSPLEDLRGISLLARIPLLIVSSAALPPTTLAEFIAYARAAREPLLFASSGVGSGAHLGGELFARAAGIRLQHAPYRGIAPALPDLFRGSVAMIMDTLQTMTPHVEAGRVRALALAAASRWPTAPQIPTASEAGLPGFEAGSWFGLLAPARTPEAVATRLSRETEAVLQQPETLTQFAGFGIEPMGSTPAAFDAFIRTEHDRWARVIREANIRLDQ